MLNLGAFTKVSINLTALLLRRESPKSKVRNSISVQVSVIVTKIMKFYSLISDLCVRRWLKCLPTPKIPSHLETREINPNYNFDTFIESFSTEEAIFQAKSLVNEKKSNQLLFITGSYGRGKTHLLHATANLYQLANPAKKVIYCRSEMFVQNMIKSFQHNSYSEFQDYYRSADLLVIDDFNYISGKHRSEIEFLNTLRYLIDSGKKIAIASNYLPHRLQELSPELKSLLYQSHIAGLRHPDKKNNPFQTVAHSAR